VHHLLIALIAVVLAGCTAAASGDRPEAIATVYPLAWVLGEVAPNLDVTSLAAGGQDPHDLELSPDQRVTLERAVVVAYLGDIGFQPQIEKAIDSTRAGVVSAAEVIGNDALRRTHDGDEVDPHLWFDARSLAEVAVAIGDAAAQADPQAADEYRANADDVASSLRSLADEVEGLLTDCRHDTVVVGHEAFAYLLEPHGLEQHGISEAGGHSEASPRDISELAAEITEQQLPGVLSESVEGRTDADAVAREAGVDVIEVSSLDIVTPEQSEREFPALLLEQAQAVAQAAECPGAS
jgi:zinc transport system substrate-binding protein